MPLLSSQVLKFFRLAVIAFVSLFVCLHLSAEEGFKYDAKGKRNPFTPLVTSDGRILKLEDEDKGQIQLEGIIYDKYGSSYAIINGTVVRVGDFIGDYQVLKIEEKRVSFIKEGLVSEIELKKEEE